MKDSSDYANPQISRFNSESKTEYHWKSIKITISEVPNQSNGEDSNVLLYNGTWLRSFPMSKELWK